MRAAPTFCGSLRGVHNDFLSVLDVDAFGQMRAVEASSVKSIDRVVLFDFGLHVGDNGKFRVFQNETTRHGGRRSQRQECFSRLVGERRPVFGSPEEAKRSVSAAAIGKFIVCRSALHVSQRVGQRAVQKILGRSGFRGSSHNGFVGICRTVQQESGLGRHDFTGGIAIVHHCLFVLCVGDDAAPHAVRHLEGFVGEEGRIAGIADGERHLLFIERHELEVGGDNHAIAVVAAICHGIAGVVIDCGERISRATQLCGSGEAIDERVTPPGVAALQLDVGTGICEALKIGCASRFVFQIYAVCAKGQTKRRGFFHGGGEGFVALRVALIIIIRSGGRHRLITSQEILALSERHDNFIVAQVVQVFKGRFERIDLGERQRLFLQRTVFGEHVFIGTDKRFPRFCGNFGICHLPLVLIEVFGCCRQVFGFQCGAFFIGQHIGKHEDLGVGIGCAIHVCRPTASDDVSFAFFFGGGGIERGGRCFSVGFQRRHFSDFVFRCHVHEWFGSVLEQHFRSALAQFEAAGIDHFAALDSIGH